MQTKIFLLQYRRFDRINYLASYTYKYYYYTCIKIPNTYGKSAPDERTINTYQLMTTCRS